jgi:UPF0716 protein FxsA
MPRMWLVLVFIGVPILEIALFIQVGGLIGLWPTLLIVVLTALGGTALMRRQGLQALRRLQDRLAQGGDPVGPIAHGAIILVAGILLLTPGFFTDSVGLILLIPAVRDRLIAWGGSRISVKTATMAARRTGPRHGPRTIETEYEILDDLPPRHAGPSGWTRHDD